MTLRRILAVSSAAALVIVAVVLLTRERGTDQERLRRIVDDIAEAASRRDVRQVLSHVSEDFRGSVRTMATREDLRHLLLGVLLRQGWSRVYVFDAEFTTEVADYQGTVIFVGAQGDKLPDDPRELAPSRVQAYRVLARFVREDGTFRILEADYQPLDAAGLLGIGP